MPGIVMHHHFGKVVYSALPEDVKNALNNINLYDYGTTCPDSFSYVNFIIILTNQTIHRKNLHRKNHIRQTQCEYSTKNSYHYKQEPFFGSI